MKKEIKDPQVMKETKSGLRLRNWSLRLTIDNSSPRACPTAPRSTLRLLTMRSVTSFPTLPPLSMDKKKGMAGLSPAPLLSSDIGVEVKLSTDWIASFVTDHSGEVFWSYLGDTSRSFRNILLLDFLGYTYFRTVS